MYTISPEGKIIIPGNLSALPKIATYDGNSMIKKSGILIEYSEEQVEELIKCSEDIVYFCKYVYIIDPDKGKCPIKLRDYQIKLLKKLFENRFNVLLASRQIGKSTVAAILILHYILFNADKKAVILANKAATSKEIFQKVRLGYEKLPYWMQVGVSEWQKTSCTLENGSSCFSTATTEDGIRGVTANLIFLDEFAFIPHNIAEDFFTSVYPTISASQESKIIIVSTPNGLNSFYALYSKALKGQNSFVPLRVDYWEVPSRDEKWKEETIKNIGATKFSQEYGNAFLGSSKTLIKATVLESLEMKDPIRIGEDNLKIYEEPIHGHTYALGVDVSKGVGGDYSVGQIIDITEEKFRQVAVYSNNQIGPRKFAKLVVKFAQLYNEAYVLVENNAEGALVADIIWNEEEYENLVDFGTTRHEIGIRATAKSKSNALTLLKEFIEEGRLEIYDQNTIYELSKFIEVRSGIYAGESGENDDLVSALYWALFIITTPFYDSSEIHGKIFNRSAEEDDEPEPYTPYHNSGEHEIEENSNWLHQW